MPLGEWKDPKSLIAFFHAKGIQNLVLRMDDVLKLPDFAVNKLRGVMAKINHEVPDKGFMVVPYEDFAPLTMEDLETLQEVTSYYRDRRWAAGYPAETHDDGSVTLVEMDEHEQKLAERPIRGRTPY